DVETALRPCNPPGHTRLLATEDDNQDRVKGTVHSNSLARKLMTEGPNASIEDLIKDALIVPETKPLDDLLADLQRHRSSMAVVIDEYGRGAGIVTVEDIIEEGVGEIDDETDPPGGGRRWGGPGALVRPGPRRIPPPPPPAPQPPGHPPPPQPGGGLAFPRAG